MNIPKHYINSRIYKIYDLFLDTTKVDGKIIGNDEEQKLEDAIWVLGLGKYYEKAILENKMTDQQKFLLVSKLLKRKKQGATSGMTENLGIAVKWLINEVETRNNKSLEQLLADFNKK